MSRQVMVGLQDYLRRKPLLLYEYVVPVGSARENIFRGFARCGKVIPVVVEHQMIEAQVSTISSSGVLLILWAR